MAKISGILTDGAGLVINDCTIELYAKKTTSKVLVQTQAFKVAENGSYTINVLPCEYDVSLIINGFPKKRLGTIQVHSDSVDGTLNDFLLNPGEEEVTPAILKQVFDARNETNKLADNAALSERNSKTSETNSAKSAQAAKVSETNSANSAKSANDSSNSAKTASASAGKFATAAKTSADSAGKFATAASVSAKNASDNANSIKTSETNAKASANAAAKSADDAKSWASTIDTSTFVKKTGDNLTGKLSINGKAVLTQDDALLCSGNLQTRNLNDLKGKQQGVYFQNANEHAKYEYNYPIGGAGSLCILKTEGDGPNGCVQIYTEYYAGRQFIRTYLDAPNVWSPWVEQITTANINRFLSIGEHRLMSFRREELPFGWYVRNGDNYLLDSPQGQALSRLSNNYKTDHRIVIKEINGQKYINVPTAFAPDGRGYFERPVNGTTQQVGFVEGDTIRNIRGSLPNGSSKAIIGHENIARGDRDGAISVYQCDDDWLQAGDRRMKWAFFDIDASRVVPTSHENRPIYMGFTPAIYLGV